MGRATEDLLAAIHGAMGDRILELLRSDDPREVTAGLQAGLKFLKDNGITATVATSNPLAEIQSALPTAAELERLMTMTPD